jgi:hypothetical protein
LFVGAGLSAAAGLPDWKNLLLAMITEIESDGVTDGSSAELRALIDAGKLLDVADHCRQRLGERRYQELLGERLRGGSGDIPEVHRLITQLPFSAVVTTNYDKLLERAYAQFKGELPKVVTSRDRESLGSLLFSGGFFILKAHGDIDDAASLVLTARDYREIIHANAAFDALFSSLLMTRSLLIVGYSLSDPDFRLLLDRQLSTFGENIPERYAVMAGVGVVEADVMKRSANIKVLAYPQGQHQEVSTFLSGLLQRLAPEHAAADSSSRVVPPAPPVIAPSPRASSSRSRLRRGSVRAPATPPSRPAEDNAPVAPAGSAPAHLPLVLESVQVRLRLRQDRVECELQSMGTPSPSHLSDPVSWTSFYREMADLFDDRAKLNLTTNYRKLGRRLGELLPRDLMAPLPANQVVTLAPDRELADIPWELAICGDDDAAPIAVARPTVRLMSGDSLLSRGLPGIRQPARVLVIGDPPAVTASAQLEDAYKEAVEIDAVYRASGLAECTLLTRREATLDAVVDTLSTTAYDVIHFAGHAWFDQHESFLIFEDETPLTSGELRSLLGPRPPAILVLNSHYTAFLPRGVRPSGNARPGSTADLPPTWHIGFTQMAVTVGVGAFIGCFESPQDRPAKVFGVTLHRELLRGAPIVHAVHKARVETLDKEHDNVSALQYVLSGDPGYCLREQA